ncbi:capsular biosynthesis protein [Paenibacillus pectinilyticus]|uniref:non-specific protein-tyrosine kinase n=1 Tax=Paenibacillus pectinilyticus TaxID=512399 RepID=A0A1C0ZSF7_9BACL|nr:CpsD/CapB family tyrosine-protein kinase [Paenibacillus pectinilyticus]OCT11020.1 capsular biosynthesis protein [Paenibacillus pectinilyticus]
MRTLTNKTSKADKAVSHQLITDIRPKSQVSEAYRTLRTNIQFSSIDHMMKTVLITSAQPAEGKSTTAANLSVAYAQEGKKVLLIDADLRKPTIHHYFAKSNRYGLTSTLANQTEIEEVIFKTTVENLFIITSGPIPPNPSELLMSQKMTALLADMATQFDMIIIDSPPTLAVADAQILATKCDGVVMVISEGKVKRDVARKAIENLERVQAKILGVVLNNKRHKKSDVSYNYYYGQ